MKIKTIRTHYEPIREKYYRMNGELATNDNLIELGLEGTLNKIGYENVLQVLPCYLGQGEYFYTIIYKDDEADDNDC